MNEKKIKKLKRKMYFADVNLFNHCLKVKTVAVFLGKLTGLSEKELLLLEINAFLHDIGKLIIPKDILNKKEKLTTEEKILIDTHAEKGYLLLKKMGLPEEICIGARYHHSENIPDEYHKIIDIIRVSDKYSALTEERVYKESFDKEKAIEIISEEEQNQKLISLLRKY